MGEVMRRPPRPYEVITGGESVSAGGGPARPGR
jgi:hypothetical protein